MSAYRIDDSLHVLDASKRQLPRQGHLLDPGVRATRLAHAAGWRGSRLASYVWIATIASALLWIVALLFGAPELLLGIWFFAEIVLVAVAVDVYETVRDDRADAIRRLLAVELPFPHDGLVELYVCDRPIIDIVFHADIPIVKLAIAVRGIDPTIIVDAIDTRTVRMFVPAGSSLARLVETILEPLHHERGIEIIRFGGVVSARPIAGATQVALA